MMKPGFLVFTANRETDRQPTEYLKDPDVTVKTRLWFCAITELEFVIPLPLSQTRKRRPQRVVSNVQANIQP